MDTLENLGLIYTESLSEVISTVTGIHLNDVTRNHDKVFDDITGVMYLHGIKSGMLCVTAKEEDVRIFCSRIVGVSPEEIPPDDLDDTMCELVNMTAGSAKLRISDTNYLFSLLQPFVIKGTLLSLVTKNITQVETGTLTDGEVTISFKVIY